jgi:2-hydroxy-6-oxonona-2,4-dienedioate hydrolase
MASPVFRDAAARARMAAWYERFLQRIPGPTESRTVPTRFGENHVLVAGPENGVPLLCLHAMRTGSAHFLSELGPLLDRVRIFAPDLPGQSVRGLDLRLPFDDSHARWLLDILDGLKLDVISLFGVSWGGYVARQTAALAPERFPRLALLVPAGIVNGSHWKGLTRMAIPWMRYRWSPSEKNLRRFLDPLLTTWDEQWAKFMGESLADMPMDLRIPPLASDEELKRLTMPVLAMGASDDISFPGAALVRRIQTLLPHAECEVIPNCKHCPPTNDEFRGWLANRLSKFLAIPATPTNR